MLSVLLAVPGDRLQGGMSLLGSVCNVIVVASRLLFAVPAFIPCSSYVAPVELVVLSVETAKAEVALV